MLQLQIVLAAVMLTKLKGKFISYHKNRFIVRSFSASKEELNINSKINFDEAKLISDFIGMIVRLVFLLAGVRYFMKNANEGDLLQLITFGSCASLGFMLSIRFGMGIQMIIFMYFLKEIALFESKIMKSIIMIMSIFQALTLYYAIYSVVTALSAKSLL